MDLEQSIKQYSEKNGYPISDFVEEHCDCGSNKFHLYSDDDNGGAYIVCSKCKKEKNIENSKEYIEEEVNNICNCDNDSLNIAIGKAFYPDSKDARWVYVGAKCDQCGLSGVYVDWKEN